MTRSERQCEEILSMSLLKESNCSDAALKVEVQPENRTGVEVTPNGNSG